MTAIGSPRHLVLLPKTSEISSEEEDIVILDSVRRGRTLLFTMRPDMGLPVLSW